MLAGGSRTRKINRPATTWSQAHLNSKNNTAYFMNSWAMAVA